MNADPSLIWRRATVGESSRTASRVSLRVCECYAINTGPSQPSRAYPRDANNPSSHWRSTQAKRLNRLEDLVGGRAASEHIGDLLPYGRPDGDEVLLRQDVRLLVKRTSDIWLNSRFHGVPPSFAIRV